MLLISIDRGEDSNNLFKNILCRKNLVIAAGIGCLIVSAFTIWYQIPGVSTEGLPVRFLEDSIPPLQYLFRIVTGLIGALTAIFLLIRKRINLFVVGAGGLMIALLFAPMIMVWDSPTAIQTIFLTKQARILDNEIYSHYQNKEIPWDRTIKLAMVDTNITVFKLIVPSKRYFQSPNITGWINGIGFGNEFLQFIKIGWPLAMIGSFLLMIGHYLQKKSQRAILSKKKICIGLTAIALSGLILATPVIVGNCYLFQARNYEIRGFYMEAIESYRNALKWIPALDYNSQYHSSLGVIFYQYRMEEEADYCNYLGNIYFNKMLFDMAESQYRKALEIRPDHPIARLSLITTSLNQGVYSYNQGHYSTARIFWEKVLQIDPNNLHALYELGACHIQMDNYDLAANCLSKVLELQSYFQIPFIVITSQTYFRLGWCHFQNKQYQQALELSRKAVDPLKW